MKIIKLTLFIFFTNLVFTGAGLTKIRSGDCTWEDCSNPPEIKSPPKSALVLKREVFISSDKIETSHTYNVRRPDDWPVRAFYKGNNDVYEFDKQGNLLIAKGKAAKGYMVELYKDDEPEWKGNEHVFYWLQTDAGHTGVDPLTYTGLQIILVNGTACSAMSEAPEYSEFIKYGTELYLNGNCDKSKKVKIDKGNFFVYYNVDVTKGYSYQPYWQVQYFNDPITPIYNREGRCIYYCDVKKYK